MSIHLSYVHTIGWRMDRTRGPASGPAPSSVETSVRARSPEGGGAPVSSTTPKT